MVPSLLGIYSMLFFKETEKEMNFLTNYKWPLTYIVIVPFVLKAPLHFNFYKILNMGGQA